MRRAAIIGPAVIGLLTLLILPPIAQDPRYHAFADQRTFFGIPNFWNVASNLPFLLVALWGGRALRSPSAFFQPWERLAYAVLLAAVAIVAAGSSYYHAWPDNDTLFWDRLPMALVFMSLLAATIGERTSPSAGRWLLLPLLAIGVTSVVWWKFSGDLRLYVVVQFYPMLALPLMLVLFPPRYTGAAGVWSMIGLYALAKILELFDHQISGFVATGGHPWKHISGAAAMLCYVETVARRRPIPGTLTTDEPRA